MRDIFSRAEFIRQAAYMSRGRNLVIEILIFILVFIVATIAQVIVMIPVFIVIIFSVPEFMELIQTMLRQAGDFSDPGSIAEYIENIAYALTDEMFLLMLFTTLFTIGAVFIYCRFIEKRSLLTLGLVRKAAFTEYLIGFAVGLLLICTVVAICFAARVLVFEGINTQVSLLTLFLYLIAFMIQGMSEELLCRGYLMVSISRRYSLPAAILTNSLVFAALHLANPGMSLLALINLTLFGILASVYVIKRGSIWGAGAMHSAWNFALGNIFGIEVSGNSLLNSLLKVSVADTGISGSAFGLEEGLANTIVMIAAILLVAFFGGKNHPDNNYYYEPGPLSGGG